LLFLKMAAVRHLGFVCGIYGLPAKILGGLFTVQNLVAIDAVISKTSQMARCVTFAVARICMILGDTSRNLA